MESKEIKILENLRKLTAKYCTTLNLSTDKSEFHTAQLKLVDYYELGCIITNMLKLCILALDSEEHIMKKSPINVSLILETVLQMFPLDELEMLSEMNEILVGDF